MGGNGWVSMDDKSIANGIAKHLEDYLGIHTAKVAVKTFSKKSLNKDPENLTIKDVSTLLEALRPTLRTLLGSDSAEMLIASLNRSYS
jgi:hypothetical protein